MIWVEEDESSIYLNKINIKFKLKNMNLIQINLNKSNNLIIPQSSFARS